ISFATVVEGVEKNSYVIIVPDVVALGNGGADLIRFVVTMECNVEKFRIVTEQYFRGFGRRNIVAGLGLVKVFEHRSALPDLIVEFAVDDWWFFEFRHAHR